MASSEPRWHPAAAREVREARDWYALRSRQAALGFLNSVDEAVASVLEAPDRYPVAGHGCRKLVFPNRYPFNLVYRVEAAGVRVIAVAHHRRKPAYWRDRQVAPRGE